MSLHAHSFISNFNTLGDFTSEYIVTNNANLIQVSNGGLSNSGAVNLSDETNDSTAIFAPDAFDLSVALTSYNISGYFLNQQASLGTLQPAFQIGFGSAPSTAFNSGGSNTFLSGLVLGNGAVEFQTGNNGATIDSGTSTTNTLMGGNWYFLSLNLTRSTTPDTFSGQISLFNSNAAGVVGSRIATSSTNITNSLIYNDTTTYAGFRTLGSTIGGNGVNLVDNFGAVPVPEPGSVVLLAIGALGVAGIRRRKAS